MSIENISAIKDKKEIKIECPNCHQRKKIRIPIKIVNQNNQLATISLPSGLVCEHNFQAFIDKNFKIRGYQKVDFEIHRMKIFENSPSAIVIVSMQGLILDCNHACEQLFGYEKENLINQTFMDLLIFPIDELPTFVERYSAILNGEIPEPKETKIKRSNGRFVWISIQETIVQSEDNPLFIVIIQNIDERKKTEQILKESDEKHRLMLANVNDFIAILNEKLEYEYINEEACLNKLGYLKDDFIGRKRLDLIHPDDLERCTKTIVESFQTGEERKINARIKHKKGYYIWFEVKGKAFIDKDRRKKELLIIRDISEHKKVEQKLKKSREQYHEAYNRAELYKYLFNRDIDKIHQTILTTNEFDSVYLKNDKNLEKLEEILKLIITHIK